MNIVVATEYGSYKRKAGRPPSMTVTNTVNTGTPILRFLMHFCRFSSERFHKYIYLWFEWPNLRDCL